MVAQQDPSREPKPQSKPDAQAAPQQPIRHKPLHDPYNKWGNPVRDAIREIDPFTWLVGGQFVISHSTSSQQETALWGDGAGGGYSISEVPSPIPPTYPLPETSHIKKVHDAGDASAVFHIGQAFLKIRIMDIPAVTREHITLAWLRQKSWSFQHPEALYHTEHDHRYYLVMSQVPGATLDSLWAEMDSDTQQYCVDAVVGFCTELKDSASGKEITGVDGGELSEHYMVISRGIDCRPEILRSDALRQGMDCSRLVFHHCDMGPTNILFDASTRSVNIIDWETAGFVPEEWMMTKFQLSSGMDLNKGEDVHDYRRRVARGLGKVGFTAVVDQWLKSREERREKEASEATAK